MPKRIQSQRHPTKVCRRCAKCATTSPLRSYSGGETDLLGGLDTLIPADEPPEHATPLRLRERGELSVDNSL